MTWGSSVIGTEGILKTGIAIEYGFVQTDKFYRQAYHTVYKVGTPLALSGSVTEFVVNSKAGYITTISDWAGPVKEAGGNYGLMSGSYGWSSTYTTLGMGLGPGISLPTKGTGAYLIGTTYLDGAPVYVGPPNYDHYNPAIPHL